MLTPRRPSSSHEQELSCRAALVEAQSLLEMAVSRLAEARQAAPPPLRGAMDDVVTRLASDAELLKAAADAAAGEH